METENQFLGTERIGKLMRQYAIPCIISLLVGALYNIVDQIFIANASYLGSYGNAANTVVFPLTVVALAYGALLEGAVLIETVFSWPGFGSYLTGSLLLGDMNAVMGCVLLVGVIFVMLNLLSDMLYQFFDPRTKS